TGCILDDEKRIATTRETWKAIKEGPARDWNHYKALGADVREAEQAQWIGPGPIHAAPRRTAADPPGIARRRAAKSSRSFLVRGAVVDRGGCCDITRAV